MVKSHLQALGYLVKTPKGYKVKTMEFPTLTAMQDRYSKDVAFRMKMQGMVIKSYQDQFMLVVEPDNSPKHVQPGTAVDPETGEILQLVAEEDE